MSASFNQTAPAIVSPSEHAHSFAEKVAVTIAVIVAQVLIVAALSVPAGAQAAGAYKVTNLLSDGSVTASFTDANFINPWAISASGTWWISAEGKGYNYLVSSTPNPGQLGTFKVIVPPASGTGTGSPAGSVTTAGATGMLLSNGTKASFLFSTLDGTISGWNSLLGNTLNPVPVALIAINNHAAGAEYTGLAIINTATASYILAANFGVGNKIEVYDSTFKPAQLAGSFTDPTLPAGYSPFSVHVLNGKVYVAYAMRSSSTPYTTVDALGNGAVSVFDTSGNFLARIATGGDLNSPWGVAIAPANFGIFGGAILVGNFGNGLINAYDPTSLSFLGQLTDASANPLTYATLWELLPGRTAVGNTTSVSGGDPNTVYFTAGLTGQQHGLFGAIANDTSSGTPSFAFSAATGAITVPNGTTAQTTVSIQPIYGFAGNVNLACSGLPSGASCAFTPVQISSTGATPTIYDVAILTRKNMGLLENTPGHLKGIIYALLFPFASIIVFRRRRSLKSLGLLNVLLLCGIGLIGLGVAVGCSSGNPTTPAGTSTVTITATAPNLSLSRTATLQLVVQ
jgi:uncharacterized protein (TIGR03118 family)